MKRISAIGSAVVCLAILAACGGGGGSSSGAPPVVPAGPTSAPAGPSSFTSSDAVAIPSPAPGATSVPVPLSSDTGGASAQAALPASASIPADTTVSSTFSTTADASLPALSVKRSAQSMKSVREGGNTSNVIAYLRMVFSADVTLPQAPGFTFTVPGTLPTTGTYWLGLYDPLRSAAGWQKGFEGPAVVSATTSKGHPATQLVFASNNQPISFTANTPYYFVVFAVDPTIASPTPVPTSVPTNAPPTSKPAAVLSSPQNIQFTSVTASTPVPLTFAQEGFSGPFSLHGDCTGIVNTSGGSPTWTITPVGQGRCVIIGQGDRGATKVVHVGVITPYETPRPTSSPTTSPSGSPQPSHSPEATHTPEATHSPEPSHSPEASHSPEPTHTPYPYPSYSPQPTHTPYTSPSPYPSRSPEPTHTPYTSPSPYPYPSRSPEPTHTPFTSPSPIASRSPEPGTSVSPTPVPTATPNPNATTAPTSKKKSV